MLNVAVQAVLAPYLCVGLRLGLVLDGKMPKYSFGATALRTMAQLSFCLKYRLLSGPQPSHSAFWSSFAFA